MDKKFAKIIWKSLFVVALYIFSNNAMATYIQAAIGNAIVGDAQAVYYNPAAMTLLKHKQLVLRDRQIWVNAHFDGTTIQNNTGFTQVGTSNSNITFNMPDNYFVAPVNKYLWVGVGELYTNYGLVNYAGSSVLRYFQQKSLATTLDFTPAIGIRFNKYLSIGGGLDIVRLKINLTTVVGSVPLGLPDTKSKNTGTDWAEGGHAGILVTPRRGTLIGFTYHSEVRTRTYGQSEFQSIPPLFNNLSIRGIDIPSSWVFSILQFFTPHLGIIGTVERIYWDSVKRLDLDGVIIRTGPLVRILPTQFLLFNLRNTWRFHVGAQYMPPGSKWIFEITLGYEQTPVDPKFQLDNSGAIMTGMSVGYKFSKKVRLLVGISHNFDLQQQINIRQGADTVIGRYNTSRTGVGARLIWNMD